MPRTLDANIAAESGDVFDMTGSGALFYTEAHVVGAGLESGAGHLFGEGMRVYAAFGMSAFGMDRMAGRIAGGGKSSHREGLCSRPYLIIDEGHGL